MIGVTYQNEYRRYLGFFSTNRHLGDYCPCFRWPCSEDAGRKIAWALLGAQALRLKHDQNEKIEGLKAQLAHLGDRGQRSNEREFNALSAVWEQFVEAYLSTYNCIVSYMEFPDLDRLQPDELNAFLESTELSVVQKEQVISSKTKTDIFGKILTLRGINKAGIDIFDIRLLLRKNGIFIPAKLSAQFEAALEIFLKAQVERRMEFRHRGQFDGKQSMYFIENADKIFDEIKTAVRERLLREA